jgi:hypothetical protein
LVPEFGRGFEEKTLRRMVQFAEVFPDPAIVATLGRQLGWSHFKEIIPLKSDLQRDFYAEMCRMEGWSVRTLRQKIGGMLYERSAPRKIRPAHPETDAPGGDRPPRSCSRSLSPRFPWS